jgi:hypothetical protein
MKSSPYTSNALNLSDGPELGDNELGVHIIHVPLEFILEQRRLSMAAGPVGTVSLSEVARYIGQAEPTDIIVFDRQPLHFVGRPGHAKELRCHPQVHKDFRDSVLLVERAQNQSVVWWSETPLTNVTIAPSGKGHSDRFYPEAKTDAPPNPFGSALQVCIEPCNGRDLYVVRSTVPVERADGHMFKIAFTIYGDPIDPDMYCGAP